MKNNIFLKFLGLSLFIIPNGYSQNTADMSGKTFEIGHTEPSGPPTEETKKAFAANETTYDLCPQLSNNQSPNTSLGIGSIACQEGVSPTGAVTLSVPLDVYEGPDNFEPKLQLVYSNQSGDGIVGYGWSVSGLSKIVTVSKNVYYDEKVQGITLDSNDVFMLDGVRLIKKSTTSTQIEYQTEQGFIKAVAYLNGSVITYFKVFYPDGSYGIYGYATNSTAKLEYPLTRLVDAYNREMTYSYVYTNNRYTITRIDYGLQTSASVEFQYTTRSNNIVTYTAGFKVTDNQLLTNVVTKFKTYIVREYKLTYTTSDDTYLLTQIGCTAEGKSLNPLKFFYGKGGSYNDYEKSETQLTEWYVSEEPGNLRLIRGKFDYGNKDDGLISLPNKLTYYNYYLHSTTFRHSERRFENLYDGTEKIFLYTGLKSSWVDAMPNLTTEKGFVDIFCVETDDVPGEEIVKVNNTVLNDTYERVQFTVYTANSITGLAKKYVRNFDFATLLVHRDDKSIHPKYYYTGDFNGDGKMEILAVSCHQPWTLTNVLTRCYIFDLENNKLLYEGQPFEYHVDYLGNTQSDADLVERNTDKLYVMDYDGDGKSDLCLINTTGTHIYTFDVSGKVLIPREVRNYAGLKRADTDNREILLGEFNGDGKTDLLLSPVKAATPVSSAWAVFYSQGNGSFEREGFSGTPYTKADHFVIQDADNDGVTDLIKYSTTGFFTFLTKNGKPSAGGNYVSLPGKSTLIATNINSRNYFSQLISLKDGIATKYSFKRNSTMDKLLTGIVNSNGVVNKIGYAMLNHTSNYSPGSGATFPYQNYQGPFIVATQLESYVKGEKKESLTYNYFNGIIHKQGRGFCGFEKITSIDNIRSRTTTQTFDPYHFGVIKEVDAPTQKEVNTYSISIFTNKTAQVLLTHKQVDDKPKGITTDYYYTYDAYGNPITESIQYEDGIGTVKTNTYLNSITTDRYCIGFLKDQTITKERGNESSTERSYISSFYGNGEKPLTKIKYFNGNQALQTTFTYNSSGMVISTTDKLYTSPNVLTTTYEYDSYGRCTKETSPTGQYVTYTYNAITGRLDSQKDDKDRQTTYTYDEFGRSKKTTYADGRWEEGSLNWVSAPSTALYCVTQTSSTDPTVKTYFDALDRVVRKSQMGIGGKEILTDLVYDSYGRVQKESFPFYGSSASAWKNTTYDNYDRLLEITESTGRKEKFGYGLKRVFHIQNGIQEDKFIDANDNVVYAIYNLMGTVKYDYRPDNQPKSIVFPGGTITYGYDKYGRKISVDDPTSGLTTYTYDDAGNIHTETNANGKTTETLYDAYNRIIKVITPEITTDYTYKDGLVSSELTGGLGKTYTYDTYGRLTKVKETLPDNKWFEKSYAYDATGKIKSVSYSSQNGLITTEEYIYDNNNLKGSKLPGGEIVHLTNEENPLGNPLSVTTGPLARTYSYDASGFPTGRNVKASDGTAVLNHTYNFDMQTANLSYRIDNIRNLKEEFTYNALNQLETYKDQSITYDNKGNLTKKSDAGEMTYDHPKNLYATTGLTASGDAFNASPQTVTYASFMRPLTISEGGYEAAFSYNGNRDRVKMTLKNQNALALTRYYAAGQYELDIKPAGTKEKLYLGGDYYSAPAVYIKENDAWKLFYIVRDYLGSILVITDNAGKVVEENSYNAWGRLRSPATQEDYKWGVAPELMLGRGYTGHEHLINFELINMNARLYDPILGRFLSPDPYIQDPYNFLNYNRYMYGLNNPFSYTDENGEFLHFLIGALIGGIVNWATHGFKFNAKGLGYFATGAAAGALGAGIGMGITATFASSTSFGAGFMGTQSAMNAISQSFSTSFLSGASIGGGAGFASGFVSGVGNGLVEGKSFGKSLVNGFRDGIIGGASGALIGGIAGGISSVRDGRDFWHGGRVIEDISMDLPQYYQVGEFDCRYETFRSFDEYYNGETTPLKELRKLYPNAEIEQINGTKMYASRRLALLEDIDIKKGKLDIASDIAKRMSANRGVIYEKNIGRILTPKGYRNFGHAMGITRVRIYNNGKILINLMNPDKSGSTAIRNIKNIHRLITVIKF